MLTFLILGVVLIGVCSLRGLLTLLAQLPRSNADFQCFILDDAEARRSLSIAAGPAHDDVVPCVVQPT
ncbi:MAG: hypothetical protein JSS58_10425 [Proteobacteria bacterium]|nr:hypothetical protein [Pseudomonadota bacterium]